MEMLKNENNSVKMIQAATAKTTTTTVYDGQVECAGAQMIFYVSIYYFHFNFNFESGNHKLL